MRNIKNALKGIGSKVSHAAALVAAVAVMNVPAGAALITYTEATGEVTFAPQELVVKIVAVILAILGAAVGLWMIGKGLSLMFRWLGIRKSV